MAAVTRRVSFSSEGGEAGAGGLGGAGGAAVKGRYMKGSFGGNKKWLAGGEPGQTGAPGTDGKPGRALQAQVQQDFAKSPGKRPAQPKSVQLPVVANKDTVSVSQRVHQLELQLKALEQRLQKLEQQSR